MSTLIKAQSLRQTEVTKKVTRNHGAKWIFYFLICSHGSSGLPKWP